MTIHRTFLNYREEGPQGEKNNLPSETQPNEVLSIKEMLANHVRGIPQHSGSGGQGHYYPEEYGYIPDPRELDLTERSDIAQRYSQIATALHTEQQQALDKLKNPPTPPPSTPVQTDPPTEDKKQP